MYADVMEFVDKRRWNDRKSRSKKQDQKQTLRSRRCRRRNINQRRKKVRVNHTCARGSAPVRAARNTDEAACCNRTGPESYLY